MAVTYATPYWKLDAASLESPRTRFFQLVSRQLVPALLAPKKNMERTLASIRLARLSLAVRAHRAAHGSYPTSLAELDVGLLGDALIDPFSGKPMLYRTEGETFKIYSVGENGKDDGGKPASWQQKPNPNSVPAPAAPNWDIVWEGRTPPEKKP